MKENKIIVSFLKEDKNKIEKVLDNCSTGNCSCMSKENKEKIKDMALKETENGINMEITGDISEQDIADAMRRSKILN